MSTPREKIVEALERYGIEPVSLVPIIADEVLKIVVGEVEREVTKDGSTLDTPEIKGKLPITEPQMLKGWGACRHEIIKLLTQNTIKDKKEE